jgi:abequosyltransferase
MGIHSVEEQSEVYMPELNAWVTASDAKEMIELLTNSEKRPLLSIGIPTYNCADNLDYCLQTILSQIGDSSLVEVVVSDNASTDDTASVVKRYMNQYSNVRYFRNKLRLSVDHNILQIAKHARGVFIKLHGDDDFVVEGSMMPLLNILSEHLDSGVVHISLFHNDGKVFEDKSTAAYLDHVGHEAAFITTTIVRREDWEVVADKDRFCDSLLNHVYLQFAILSSVNPKFTIMNYSSMFTYAGKTLEAYKLAGDFAGNYLKVLNHFIDNGLTADDIERNKRSNP